MPCTDTFAARPRMSATPSPWPDRLAVGASAACLLHCLLPSLLVAAAPAAARYLSLPEGYHLAAVVAAVPISAWAMMSGYRRHGLLLPAMLGIAGLTLLVFGALTGAGDLLETGLSLAGSVILAAAHLRNRQLRTRPPVRGTSA